MIHTSQSLAAVRDILPRLKGVKRQGPQWIARCPTHDDEKASLSIAEGREGKVLVHCHAGCTPEVVLSALNIQTNGHHANGNGRREVAVYPYQDEHGKELFQAVRFDPKDFRQRQKTNNGYVWNLNGVRRVLYHLPQLLASDPGGFVQICEGEKDVESAERLGFVATCNALGAGKWRPEYNESLRGRHVVVLPHNDKPGRDHGQQAAQSLQGVAASVKVLDLGVAKKGGDLTDWIEAGGTADQLRELIDAAPEFAALVSSKKVSPIVSAVELMAAHFPDPRWAVLGLLLEGLSILASKPKLGKTFFSLGIALAIASGGRALGQIEAEAGDVLYCALEDGARRIQARLRRMLAGGKVPPNLHFAFEWPRLDEGGIEKFQDWTTSHPNVRLIVIDTLKRVRPVESGRGRLYDGDYDALGPLADLAHKNNIAILVVHHTRKMQSEDPLDLVSGSLGLTGAADAVLVMLRLRGQADAVLHAQGRDFEDKEIALRWDSQIFGWRILGDAAEYRRSDERKAVIELLKKSGPLGPKAVSDLLGREHSATKKLLWTMAGDGELCTTKKGIYSLPGNPGNPVTGEPYCEPTSAEWSQAAKDPAEWDRLVIAAERAAYR
jgi:AAA domain-containing protein